MPPAKGSPASGAPPAGSPGRRWRGDLAAGSRAARGPSVCSQLPHRGGIYLANKFNDQFVLVTGALPQINYSKFKYNHWLILTHSGHGEQFIPPNERPPGPAPPALRGAPPTPLTARGGEALQLPLLQDPDSKAWRQVLAPRTAGRRRHFLQTGPGSPGLSGGLSVFHPVFHWSEVRPEDPAGSHPTGPAALRTPA